jgi:hypothetical protein
MTRPVRGPGSGREPRSRNTARAGVSCPTMPGIDRWIVLVLVGCIAAPSANAAPPPCVDTSPRPKPRILATGIAAIVEPPSPASPVFLGWGTPNGHHHQLRRRSLRPVDRGKGVRIADDRYQYRLECQNDCNSERRTSLGRARGVVRIDPKTGRRLRLTRDYHGIGNLLPYRDHVYWGTFPHDHGGGVYRVHRDGGPTTEVWSGDAVRDLLPYPDGILVVAARSIVWIPADGSAAQVVSRGVQSTAVLAGDSFYVAEYGHPYWASPDAGFIRRIPRDGRPPMQLAEPLRWPTAIAVHRDTVYFVRQESGAIWSVPATGGAVRAVVTANTAPGQPCLHALGLWADDRGLFLWYGLEFLGGALYVVPWATVRARGRTPAE